MSTSRPTAVFPIVSGNTAFSPFCYQNAALVHREIKQSNYRITSSNYTERMLSLVAFLRYCRPFDLMLNHQLDTLRDFIYNLYNNVVFNLHITGVHERVEQEKNALIEILTTQKVPQDLAIHGLLKTFFPIYQHLNLLELIDELFYDFACTNVGRILEFVKEKADAARQPYTFADIYTLQIEPLDGTKFLDYEAADDLYTLTGGRFRCSVSKVEFNINLDGSLAAQSWHAKAANTFATVMLDHSTRLGWYAMSLSATPDQADDIDSACRKLPIEKNRGMCGKVYINLPSLNYIHHHPS